MWVSNVGSSVSVNPRLVWINVWVSVSKITGYILVSVMMISMALLSYQYPPCSGITWLSCTIIERCSNRFIWTAYSKQHQEHLASGLVPTKDLRVQWPLAGWQETNTSMGGLIKYRCPVVRKLLVRSWTMPPWLPIIHLIVVLLISMPTSTFSMESLIHCSLSQAAWIKHILLNMLYLIFNQWPSRPIAPTNHFPSLFGRNRILLVVVRSFICQRTVMVAAQHASIC